MPRWPNAHLKACFFIFPTMEDAKNGKDTGGCGMFMSVRWESEPSRRHIYAVTCEHVLDGAKPNVIRATRTDRDEPDMIPAPRETWFLDEPNDLAIKLIADARFYTHDGFYERQLTDDLINDYSIGIGDEVFSIGRFVDLHGHRTNRPLLRSGIISAMPEFPVTREKRPATDSYIVEMRSRSGFSGSPVYVYLPPPQLRYEKSEKAMATNNAGDPLIKMFHFYGPWLLGIHWGEVRIMGPDVPSLIGRTDVSEEEKKIAMGSGMIGVVPCSRLANLFKREDVMRERRAIEDQANEHGSDAVEQSSPPATDGNTKHLEDFNRLLNVAARKQKQDR